MEVQDLRVFWAVTILGCALCYIAAKLVITILKDKYFILEFIIKISGHELYEMGKSDYDGSPMRKNKLTGEVEEWQYSKPRAGYGLYSNWTEAGWRKTVFPFSPLK